MTRANKQAKELYDFEEDYKLFIPDFLLKM